MKKAGFKRIIALALSIVMAVGMLPTIANAQSSVNHTVQNDGVTYDLPRLPTASNDYVLMKNTASKDVVLLVGVQDGYIGSDMKNIFNYNFEYQRTNFNSYVSVFDGITYSHWTATSGTPSFSLSGYEVLYKSKDMYLVSGKQLFTTLPEEVTWDDNIIITYSNGAYRLYKPANNIGVWVDENNINCNFVYRNTLTSANQTVSRYTYNINARTWSGGTYGRTEGTPAETFYFTSDVFLTDGTVKRTGQREFYKQSSKSEEDDLIYDLSSLLTTNSYILLRNTSSKRLVLMIGEDNGYFGSDTKTIWNYNSSYGITNFTAGYTSTFDGEKYGGWESTNLGNSFDLSEYEIVHKSKTMYPVSGKHIFATLPEGVTLEDKIIISYSNGAYRLYKPANNNGMWVDGDNVKCNFVYRNTLTSANQTLSRYTYNMNTRTWSKGTFGRTEGYDYEIFYVGSDVFSTDGTVLRVGQRDFYAQSVKTSELQFEPLKPEEAKEFLKFIANVPKLNPIEIDKELPECYAFLVGTIENPQKELEAKVQFISYFYLCMDAQLAKMDQRIEIGTSYLTKWIKEDTEVAKNIFEVIKDELWNDLKGTVAKGKDIPKMSIGYDLATSFMDYSELFIHSVGSILAVERKHDINYLKAYLKLLEAEHNGDQYNSLYWKFICESILNDRFFEGNPQEMRKYAGYIFSIEHSIPINLLAN